MLILYSTFEDNLSTRDKTVSPKVSLVQRFHCSVQVQVYTFWTWLISLCFLFKFRVTFLSLPLSDSSIRSESLGVSSTGPRSTSTLSTVTHSSIRRFTARNNSQTHFSLIVALSMHQSLLASTFLALFQHFLAFFH